MITYLFFVLALLAGCSDKPQSQVSSCITAEFEKAMGGKGFWEFDLMMSHHDSKERYRALKRLYERHPPATTEPSATARVPRIIHQIWLGPKKPPDFFEEYKRTWQALHPTWEYHLWTDREVGDMDFELRDLYNQSSNWGEKSDILRAEILDRFGGLYVDSDFECVKCFDALNDRYDFYAGIEPPHMGIHPRTFPELTVSNALIGCCAGHPIIKAWKQRIRAKWDAVSFHLPESKARVLERTFFTFGEAVHREVYDEQYANIVLPATYFYPYTFAELALGRKKKPSTVRRRIKAIMMSLPFVSGTPAPFSVLQPETMAIHYWGGSWTKSPDEQLFEMHQEMVAMEAHLTKELLHLQEELRQLKGHIPLVSQNLGRPSPQDEASAALGDLGCVGEHSLRSPALHLPPPAEPPTQVLKRERYTSPGRQ